VLRKLKESKSNLIFIMVLALALTAELNGVTDLRPLDTEDSPYHYTFKVQCTSCRETHPNWVTTTRFVRSLQSLSYQNVFPPPKKRADTA
jgi:hypothetical protein